MWKVAMQEQGQCKDCRFAAEAVGFQHPPLTCGNRAGLDGRWVVVEPTGWCPNFKPRYEAEESIFASFVQAETKIVNSG